MNESATMSAAVLSQSGAPFAIETVARPKVGAGRVLVQIHASGVNPLDLKIHAGEAAHARHPFPATLGMDLAGRVEEVGAGVTSFRPRDEVYGMTGGVGGVQGSLAEYAAVDADLLALKPTNLSMREAASLPLVFITAWEGLVDRAGVRSGQKVLVQGAGGVGRLVIQIARAFGAEVFAVDGAHKRPLIEALGATAIDFRAETVESYVEAHTAGRGFDIVYDTVGGPALDTSFRAVARFGHVTSCLGWGTHALAPLSFRAASYSGVFTLLPLLTGEGRAHHGAILSEAARMVEIGKVTAQLDPRRFALKDVDEAYAALRRGDVAGKIVVDVQSETGRVSS